MSDTKKYYWLKLKRDFFKRHDITVIESMQNGDKYLLFYMKLLVESIDHDGALRFSDTVPYNDSMLAAITHTDIDIVRSAVKVFQQFGMMDMMDDGTLFMKQTETMIGDETKWAEKKRLYRENQKLIETNEGQKRTLSDKSIELEKDIEIDKETKSIDIHSKQEVKKEDQFLIFYTSYPKKTNKTDAKKTFDKLIKSGITLDFILSKLKVYESQILRERIEEKYIRNPQRFLNTLDDYELPLKQEVKKAVKQVCPKCGAPVEFGQCTSCGIFVGLDGREVIL